MKLCKGRERMQIRKKRDEEEEEEGDGDCPLLSHDQAR